MKDFGVAALLIIGLTASMGTSFLQNRYYSRRVNELVHDNPTVGCTVVTGRSKGRTRGAVALLLIRDGTVPVIERALVMEGASVFARFRERPELRGAVGSLPEMRSSRRVRAVEDALERYRELQAGGPQSITRGRVRPG